MRIIKFKSNEEHEHILHKIKKAKAYLEDIEECVEDAIDEINEEADYRGSRYRHEYDEDDMRHDGRYGYRRGGRRM